MFEILKKKRAKIVLMFSLSFQLFSSEYAASETAGKSNHIKF